MIQELSLVGIDADSFINTCFIQAEAQWLDPTLYRNITTEAQNGQLHDLLFQHVKSLLPSREQQFEDKIRETFNMPILERMRKCFWYEDFEWARNFRNVQKCLRRNGGIE